MEPRKEVLKKTPEQRKEARKSRFQIVKLEERIAPSPCRNPGCHGGGGGGGCHTNPQGKLVGNC